MDGLANSFDERSDGNTAGIHFLLMEINLAMTFIDLAETTGIQETVTRNHRNARIAYDTILRLLPNLTPSEAQQQAIDDGLAIVKARLVAVGQQF